MYDTIPSRCNSDCDGLLMTRLRNGRGPNTVAKTGAPPLSRKARWRRRFKHLGIALGIIVAPLIIVSAAAVYATQASAIDEIASEYKAVESSAAATHAEFETARASQRGQAVLALPLLTSLEWASFERAIADDDDKDLESLRTTFTTWGAQNIWFPDLRARHAEFIDGLTLSITSKERAEYSAVYAMDVICAGAPADDDTDDSATDRLPELFEADATGSLLTALVAAAPAVCGLPV
jgi:hypothetical protein